MPVATRTNTRQGTLDSPSKRTKTASIDSPGGDVDMSSYTGTSPSPGSLDSAGPTRERGNSGSGWNTPAMTSPSVDVSMLAKHGSAPPSPVLKGLKDGAHANANTRKNLRVIGVDFDDVCAQFIPTVCLEHNLRYGSDITEADMHTYFFFQNKGWGSPADAARKMKGLDRLLHKTAPVPGFVEGLKALHAMGHPIHIVTARSPASHDDIVAWLGELGITVGTGEEDTIAALWFTDTYGGTKPELGERGSTESAIEREEKLNEQLKEVWREGVGKGKGGKIKLRASVLRAINAALFIDDHHGNLQPILDADPPVPCLLFGTYAWNRSRSGVSSPVELMSYEERLASGLALPASQIEEGNGLYRAATWVDVVKFVKDWDEEDKSA
ncbi:hypothetical protein EHS25_003267 [Saitozyma podzolica]|uniref:Uncharacterized protein n=1 Tax=Saitozyma podzolica TaxID=1890683 RepID=A0A427Y8D6_9TREE|nr:hypothetical protein EHS25_003267 [Saitozyma podzolica]